MIPAKSLQGTREGRDERTFGFSVCALSKPSCFKPYLQVRVLGDHGGMTAQIISKDKGIDPLAAVPWQEVPVVCSEPWRGLTEPVLGLRSERRIAVAETNGRRERRP